VAGGVRVMSYSLRHTRLVCPNKCEDAVEIVHPFTHISICSECDARMVPQDALRSHPRITVVEVVSILLIAAFVFYVVAAFAT
jgi:hypothetical protein